MIKCVVCINNTVVFLLVIRKLIVVGLLFLFDMYTYVLYVIRRKGPSGSRQEGEDGDNCIIHIYVLYILLGGRGRAGAGRRGKTVTTTLCICMYYMYYSEEGAEREPVGGERR